MSQIIKIIVNLRFLYQIMKKKKKLTDKMVYIYIIIYKNLNFIYLYFILFFNKIKR